MEDNESQNSNSISKKKKLHTPTVSSHLTSITFQVKEFQQQYSKILELERNEFLESQNVDISNEDLRIITEYEQVEIAIKTALTNGEYFNENIITPDPQIENGQKNLHVCKPDFKLKIRKKEINHITPTLIEKDTNEPFQQMEKNELVLNVSVYHSTKYLKTQEFLVYGSEKLTDLKDRIYCIQDHIASDLNIRSGYFFIENVFYDDTRFPENKIYSKYIIDWVKLNQRIKEPRLGVYTSQKMEDSCFNDLTIRLGAHYLYCHQGNCEHLIVFNNIRFFHNQDNQNKSAYPLHIFQSKFRRRKCSICDIYPAKYVTYDDKLCQENPCLFCDHCYQPLHYNLAGDLLYNYKAYPYFHE